MTQQHNEDLSIAHEMERALLGSEWHPLSCGCLLGIHCRMPSKPAYIHVKVRGHRLCDRHRVNTFLHGWWGEKARVFNWYTSDPHVPAPISLAEFQAAWDVLSPDTELWPGKPWVLSEEGDYKIYRTGRVFTVQGDLTS